MAAVLKFLICFKFHRVSSWLCLLHTLQVKKHSERKEIGIGTIITGLLIPTTHERDLNRNSCMLIYCSHNICRECSPVTRSEQRHTGCFPHEVSNQSTEWSINRSDRTPTFVLFVVCLCCVIKIVCRNVDNWRQLCLFYEIWESNYVP